MPVVLVGLMVFLLLSPYVLLISQFSLNLQIHSEDFLWALKNTLLQSLGSSLMSVFLGIAGGLGLLWLRRVAKAKTYFWFEKLLLLPTILPSLFVVVACLGVLQPFPYGKVGVVVIHTIINIGLVSVLFSQIAINKLSSLGTLALVEGAQRSQFLRVGVLGYLSPDIFYLFVYIFSVSMASFNVPLLVGGSSGTTLEVLIYENLVINQNWSQALALSLIQMVIIGGLGLFNRPSHLGLDLKADQALLELAEWKWGLLFPVGAFLITVCPPLFSIPSGLAQLKVLQVTLVELARPAIMSLSIGLLTGVLLFFLLFCSCLTFLSRGWRRFILLYVPPSGILMGFAFFILSRWIHLSIVGQILLGLSIIYFVSLYRLAIASPLASLRGQVEVATVLGATPISILNKIIFPQVLQPMIFAAAIGSMWASGDFALSTVLSSDDFHLALVVKSLAGSYRLDAAQALMFILYLVAMICFVFWWRLGDVLDRKFNR